LAREGKNPLDNEHEIIVEPHVSKRASFIPVDLQERYPISDLNERINARNEGQKRYGKKNYAGRIPEYNINSPQGILDSKRKMGKSLEKDQEDTIRIYRGLTKPFDPNYDNSRTDAPSGYSTWTDSENLAREYSKTDGKEGHVYYVDLPKDKMGRGVVDENPNSKTYGDRHLFFHNDKPAGINGVKGKEYLLYHHHDLYNPAKILNKKDRCWTGYKPVAGKKPYSRGSCAPIQKSFAKAEPLMKPFVSESQRRFAYANPKKFGGKKGLKEWESKTHGKLPEKLEKTKITPYQRNDLETGREGFAVYKIHPQEFLNLTANESFKPTIHSQARPHDFYENLKAKDEVGAPYLATDPDGNILGHEGRHRAAAALKAGHDSMDIGLVASSSEYPVEKYGWRWKRRIPIPQKLIAQKFGLPDDPTHEHVVDHTKIEHIEPMYGDQFNKAESLIGGKGDKSKKLQKSPMILDTGGSDWAINRLQDADSAIDYGQVLSSNQIGVNLFHHHVKEGDVHHHILTENKDPTLGGAIAMLSGHPKKNKHLQISTSAVDPDLQGKGYGKQLYSIAAKIHGGIESDRNITEEAHNLYQGFSKNPDFTTKLGLTQYDLAGKNSPYKYQKEALRYRHVVKPNKKSESLIGGKGDKSKTSDFDPKQVAMGRKVEMEHTDNPKVAEEILRDHLKENPRYYSKLKQIGLADELKKSKTIPFHEVANHVDDLHFEGANRGNPEIDTDDEGNPDLFGIHKHPSYELKSVPIESIQHGDPSFPSAVAKYAQKAKEGSPFPPVLLNQYGEALDGWHRIAAAKQIGHTHIPAYIPAISKSDSFKKSENKSAEETVKLYHLTDNPKFKLNSNFAPQDNSIAINDRSGQKGIYLAKDPETWVNGHGYARPFLAEFHVPKSTLNHKDVGGRWGGEKFIPSHLHDQIKLHRVIPLDAHAREQYGSHGWVEGAAGKEFDTGNPVDRNNRAAFKGYTYSGKDVRDMSPDEAGSLKQHFKQAQKTGNLGKSELQKGLKGDWKKEGYTLKHTSYPVENFDGSIQPNFIQHHIEAFHPTHGSVGEAMFSQENGLLRPNDDEGRSVIVDDPHRRKGLASAMYSLIEKKTGMKIVPSSVQDSGGQALWSQPNRPFGKSELEKAQPVDWKQYGIMHDTDKYGIHHINIHTKHSTNTPEHIAEFQFVDDHPANPNQLTPMLSEVHPDHRRKGLASAAYQYAEQVFGKKIARSPSQTFEAKKMWNQPDRPFGKSELGKLNQVLSETRQRMARLKHHQSQPAKTALYPTRGKDNGHSVLISPDFNHEGKWRKTYFWPNNEPVGHAEGLDYPEAIRHAYDSGADLENPIPDFDKSELQKMSQPRLTFPAFKSPTRPDQEVQPVENERQKKVFGAKIANYLRPDTVGKYNSYEQQPDGSMKFLSSKPQKISYQSMRDNDATYYSNKIGRGNLGINVPVTPVNQGDQKRGRKSFQAAVAGKLRSKYEPRNDDQKEREAKWLKEYNQIVVDHNNRYTEWRNKGMALKNPSPQEWAEHMVSKPPKPKLPRKPSVKALDTTKLGSKEQVGRGKAYDSAIEHEAFHGTVDNLENKAGANTARKAIVELSKPFKDAGVHDLLSSFVEEGMGYKRNSPSFDEEVLANTRDILTDPRKRQLFRSFIQNHRKHNHLPPVQRDRIFWEAEPKIKAAWKKAHQISQQFKPEKE